MDIAEWVVLIGGVVLIAGTLWFFFGAREAVSAGRTASGVQEIKITVKGGYSPDVIMLKQGIPARLNFYRDERASCSEQIVFSDFGIVRDLPAFKTTAVDFTPQQSGEFTFTCGMNMMRGKLIVESA